MSKQILRVLLAALFILILIASGCKPKPGGQGTSTTGGGVVAAGGNWTGDAQDFKVTYFDGSQANISANAGKPVIVNFWAAW